MAGNAGFESRIRVKWRVNSEGLSAVSKTDGV